MDVVHLLEGDERLVADNGYRGYPQFFDTPWRHLNNEEQRRRKALVRARHENGNRRFKQWRILKEEFRHPLVKHGMVTMAVVNVEQVLIMERPVWQVDYYDRGDDFEV